MKHAVVPTDFSTRSLQVIHDLVHFYPNEPVKVTLLHLVDIPFAIGDLLFRLQRTESRFPVPDAFKEACEILRNKYEGRIESLTTAIRYGTTTAFLSNLLEGMETDAVFIQDGFEPGRYFEDSVQMLPMLRKSGVKIIETKPAPVRQHISPAGIGSLLVSMQ